MPSKIGKQRALRKLYYQKCKEKILLEARKAYAAEPEKATSCNVYETNRDRIKVHSQKAKKPKLVKAKEEDSKQQGQDDSDRARALRKQYYQKHKEKILLKARKAYAANPEPKKATSRKVYEAKRDRIKAHSQKAKEVKAREEDTKQQGQDDSDRAREYVLVITHPPT